MWHFSLIDHSEHESVWSFHKYPKCIVINMGKYTLYIESLTP